MKILITLFLLVAGARADSIETSDKATVYGTIQRMDQVELVLTGRFSSPGGIVTKELKYPRNTIVKIEFNSTTFNAGSPPDTGFLPPNTSKAAANSVSQDTAVLTGGQRKLCDGATIDDQHHLHCGKEDYPRNGVIRVFLAAK